MTPTIISSDHLARLAAVYGRQSTTGQVEHNTGSTDYQRAQADWARRWGWPPERIVRFEDFGLSGAAALHRPSYQKLRAQIRSREIGIVLVSDITRLGRDTKELLDLIRECNAYNVLIAVDGKIQNLTDTAEWFTAGLFALLAEFDGLTRRDTLQRGRMAKLRAGKAVSAAPAGYVSQPDKSWIKDPDSVVRAGVVAVFRTFREHRTLHATVVALRAAGLKVPRQRTGRPVHWAEPEVTMLQEMLHHPAYKGEYHYRRHVDDRTKPRSAKGRYRPRLATADETIVIKDHHEPYVTPEEWDEVQSIFRANGWSGERANAGPGRGQVQGLIRCQVHGRLLGPRYKDSTGPRGHSYGCSGDYQNGGTGCVSVPGAPIDDAVADAVMARLTAPSVQLLRDALDAALTGQHAARRRHEMEVHRLRGEALSLEEKLAMLDADSHGVFKVLEHRLEKVTRQLHELQRMEASRESGDRRRDAETLSELAAIGADLPLIWYAPTTTHRDRKELMRMVVRRVVVEGRDAERVSLRIEWVDGAPPKQFEVWLALGIRRLIAERVRDGVDTEAIAEELKGIRARTQRGNEWTVSRVDHAVWQLRRDGKLAPATGKTVQQIIGSLAQDGATSREIAEELVRGLGYGPGRGATGPGRG